MQITSIQGDLMFIFDKLSEFVVIFVSNLIFSAVKNVVSFKLNEFSRKRGRRTMRNYVETFSLYNGYNIAPEVLTKIS